MARVTPLYGLPYPLPSEPIRDGAATIRALAERLENVIADIPEHGTVPAPVTACLTRSTSQSIPNAVDTDVAFSTTQWAIGDADTEHKWGANAGALTIPVTGYYDVTANTIYNDPTPFNTAGILYRVRFTSTQANLAATTGPGSNNAGTLNVSTTVRLEAGDRIKWAVYQNSGSPKAIGTTWFGGESYPRLSATLIARA